MDPKTQARFAARAQVIKAMGHATRLFIVDRLAEGELCVRDIQALIGDDLSTVSRHLAVLRNAGIVASRREGNQIFYRLECPCVMSFFTCVEKVLTSQGGGTLQSLASRR